MSRRLLIREQSPGLVLLLATVTALLWANSPWSASYEALWQRSLTVGFDAYSFTEPLVVWINDGLMAIFFFVVGLEIKGEILTGRLSSPRKAALPIVAAAGGMVVPAAFYLCFNIGTPRAAGWGIPMATDIAFALGVLALLGNRIPPGLKVFLAALAIVDDIGAVAVIALFYSSELVPLHLWIASAYFATLVAINRIGIQNPLPYALVGIAGVWHCFSLSGVHPTVAGIVLAMTIPSKGTARASGKSPLQNIKVSFHPWVSFVVLPLFALANAGVPLNWNVASQLGNPVAIGIVTGLALGKQIGIFSSAWVAVRTGLASLPCGVSWRDLYGVSVLGGIGFTMSLFIASLAFSGTPALSVAKSAILIASILSGLIGWLVLRTKSANDPRNPRDLAA